MYFTKLTLCEDQSEVFIVLALFSRGLKPVFLASCLKTVGFSYVEAGADGIYACVFKCVYVTSVKYDEFRIFGKIAKSLLLNKRFLLPVKSLQTVCERKSFSFSCHAIIAVKKYWFSLEKKNSFPLHLLLCHISV